MDAIEKLAREPNPNVAVIHEAMQHFPEGSWMRGALDHAAAELAVLHRRCQRTALTLPKGYVLVPVRPTDAMKDAVESIRMPHAYLRTGIRIADFHERYSAMIAARPEVP